MPASFFVRVTLRNPRRLQERRNLGFLWWGEEFGVVHLVFMPLTTVVEGLDFSQHRHGLEAVMDRLFYQGNCGHNLRWLQAQKESFIRVEETVSCGITELSLEDEFQDIARLVLDLPFCQLEHWVRHL